MNYITIMVSGDQKNVAYFGQGFQKIGNVIPFGTGYDING
jgi:hypothetical protein